MSIPTNLSQPADPVASPSGVRGAGMADPVRDAQQTFRALLDAFGRPTTTVSVPCRTGSPAALTQGVAALVLTVADDSTPLWLDPVFADDGDVTAWIRFHTGAPLVDDPAQAAFALVAAPSCLPALGSFALGTDEAPHTSTTVVVQVTGPACGPALVADGPGFPVPALWHPPDLPPDFTTQWAGNGALFPRGVDLVLASDDALVALPRTTRLLTATEV
ncbi:MAG: phosphonate C-P lyase system protein PhnH [Micrococcales bacterium]|nr:phosphonate C-P lyase system protein PhnH [Micrococcales bacterium]